MNISLDLIIVSCFSVLIILLGFFLAAFHNQVKELTALVNTLTVGVAIEKEKTQQHERTLIDLKHILNTKLNINVA